MRLNRKWSGWVVRLHWWRWLSLSCLPGKTYWVSVVPADLPISRNIPDLSVRAYSPCLSSACFGKELPAPRLLSVLLPESHFVYSLMNSHPPFLETIPGCTLPIRTERAVLKFLF